MKLFLLLWCIGSYRIDRHQKALGLGGRSLPLDAAPEITNSVTRHGQSFKTSPAYEACKREEQALLSALEGNATDSATILLRISSKSGLALSWRKAAPWRSVNFAVELLIPE